MADSGEFRGLSAAVEGYAPFRPRVSFAYLAADDTAGAFEDLQDARADDPLAHKPAARLPAGSIGAPLQVSEAAPLSEYQWSGPGRPEPLKRVFDLACGLAALAFTAPLLLLVAVLVRASGEGPVLVRSRRVGRLGREFDVLNFRTRPGSGKQRSRFGRFLHASGLKALPQLINVVRGDLSLVGPRPVTEQGLSEYGLDVIYYLSSRPGLTGEWRVDRSMNGGRNGRNPAYRRYARSRTFASDLRFLAIMLPRQTFSKNSV